MKLKELLPRQIPTGTAKKNKTKTTKNKKKQKKQKTNLEYV